MNKYTRGVGLAALATVTLVGCGREIYENQTMAHGADVAVYYEYPQVMSIQIGHLDDDQKYFKEVINIDRKNIWSCLQNEHPPFTVKVRPDLKNYNSKLIPLSKEVCTLVKSVHNDWIEKGQFIPYNKRKFRTYTGVNQ